MYNYNIRIVVSVIQKEGKKKRLAPFFEFWYVRIFLGFKLDYRGWHHPLRPP